MELEMKNRKMRTFGITSFVLHILAMVFMLSDHLWATVVPGANWMTCVGRLAFPIFAFMTVEGFFHTKNVKKYAKRLFLFALLSEIPFNLMMGGSVIYPFQQNVLWCFLLGLGLMHLNEKAKNTGKWWIRVLTAIGTIALGFLVGLFSMMDYMHYGVMMLLVFYFFRGKEWWNYVGQLLCLAYINSEMGGLTYELNWFGTTFFFRQQSFAVLSLIPIWLYNGKQGYHSKWFQILCYAFYPVHMLILALLMMF